MRRSIPGGPTWWKVPNPGKRSRASSLRCGVTRTLHYTQLEAGADSKAESEEFHLRSFETYLGSTLRRPRRFGRQSHF